LIDSFIHSFIINRGVSSALWCSWYTSYASYACRDDGKHGVIRERTSNVERDARTIDVVVVVVVDVAMRRVGVGAVEGARARRSVRRSRCE